MGELLRTGSGRYPESLSILDSGFRRNDKSIEYYGMKIFKLRHYPRFPLEFTPYHDTGRE